MYLYTSIGSKIYTHKFNHNTSLKEHIIVINYLPLITVSISLQQFLLFLGHAVSSIPHRI